MCSRMTVRGGQKRSSWSLSMVKPMISSGSLCLWMIAPLWWVLKGMIGGEARRMCLRMMVKYGQKRSSWSLPMGKPMISSGSLCLFQIVPLSWVLQGTATMAGFLVRCMYSRMTVRCGQKRPS